LSSATLDEIRLSAQTIVKGTDGDGGKNEGVAHLVDQPSMTEMFQYIQSLGTTQRLAPPLSLFILL
jgi:hypothetical protein